jgi:hypothetical protein
MVNMMKKSALCFAGVLIIAIAALNPALASWIEVPVDGLNGYYGPDTTHTVGTFAVSVDTEDVLSVRMRITGNLVWPSYCSCPGSGISFNGNYIFANMSTSSGDWYTSPIYVTQRVSFVIEPAWQPIREPTWEFLSSGSGTFVLSSYARPLPFGCSYQHGSSDGTVEVIDAKLIFVLRDETPVEQSTWGRIKSLYLTD